MFFTMGVSLNADKLSAYAMAENSSSKVMKMLRFTLKRAMARSSNRTQTESSL